MPTPNNTNKSLRWVSGIPFLREAALVTQYINAKKAQEKAAEEAAKKPRGREIIKKPKPQSFADDYEEPITTTSGITVRNRPGERVRFSDVNGGGEVNVVKRVRPNTSPTTKASTTIEDGMNKQLFQKTHFSDLSYTDPKWDIPFVDDKTAIINGNTVSLNFVDSVLKYANIHNKDVRKAENSGSREPRQIYLEEALGLGNQETENGTHPLYNYMEEYKTDTPQEREHKKEQNRNLANANYFKAFGFIPQDAFIRNWHYSHTKVDKNTPPLLDGFRYYSQGYYNPGEDGSNREKHFRDVQRKGIKMLQNKDIVNYINRENLQAKYPNAFIRLPKQ